MTDVAGNVSAPDATIRSLDEWETVQKEHEGAPVLLQCGSPVCRNCPAFTEQINDLKEDWFFFHVYVDTHSCEEDLLDELQVTKLPAYVLLSSRDKAHGQNSTPSDVANAIRTHCAPTLRLDEDF
jgi:thiol-disulfide isomerase/thioredoxin